MPVWVEGRMLAKFSTHDMIYNVCLQLQRKRMSVGCLSLHDSASHDGGMGPEIAPALLPTTGKSF
jgi:hypothetical protein